MRRDAVNVVTTVWHTTADRHNKGDSAFGLTSDPGGKTRLLEAPEARGSSP